MFSHEERVKAIQLFLKYDCSYAATIHELGYPSSVGTSQMVQGIFDIWRSSFGAPKKIKVF